ncbi:annexin A4-like isoform X1 [Amphiura filiformis]|uniref:annexin A4-like isoform X1 n=1 Tax=Amphiura filiformis TaxID=82378 RepID=UPI003B2275B0
MCAAGREENFEVDQDKAKKDAAQLYNAGERYWGTNEAEIQRILAIRSYTQLQATFEEYNKISKLGIDGAIESETSGDLKDGYLAIVKCVRNRAAFFAERINHAIKGLGTNNDMLIRCIVSRCEVDTVKIKEEYEKAYGTSLVDAVKGDTSGHYKHVLVALLGERSS